jgi:Protein of unknown function (DUF3352)
MTLHVRLHPRRLHCELRAARPLPSLRGALWGFVIRAAALIAVSLLIGCGGGGSADDGSPATAVPADALFYAEMVVRPKGSLREDALDAAGKVLVTDDPEGRIRELMREAFEDTGEDFDFDRDVKPWLGERAGFWVRPTEAKDNFGVLLLSATDTDTAQQSLRASLERGGEPVSERSHGDTDYMVNADEEVAAGIVGDFVAIGREPELVRTIDAAEGDSLAEADEYADAVGVLADERLAHFWADTPALFELAARDDPDLDRLRSLVPLGDLPPVAGAFLANGDRLAVEIEARASKDLGLETSGTPLLQELPGDAWAATGSSDLGESLRKSLDRFGGALGGVAVRGEVRRELGLDLDRDILDWIGHTGFFVRGTTPDTVDGGIVIQPTDEDRAADAFGRIVGAIQQFGDARARPVDIEGADQAFAIQDDSAPRPIVLARGSGLVVATYGEAAAEAALSDDDRLGEGDVYAEAEELVGMEPSLLVSMPQLLELADAAGAGSDPEFLEMRHYLEAFSVIAVGVNSGGKEATVRFGAGLR